MTTPQTGSHTSVRASGRPAPVMERNYDRPAALDNPRAPRRGSGMPNFEKYA